MTESMRAIVLTGHGGLEKLEFHSLQFQVQILLRCLLVLELQELEICLSKQKRIPLV